MTHFLIIALLVVAAIRELGPGRLLLEDWITAHPALAVVGAVGPFVLLGAVQAGAGWICGRRLDRRGDARAIRSFERLSGGVRMATLPLHASAVLLFGWLDRVRGWVGDLVAVDEVLAVLPAVVVLLVSWGAAEPIERRVRESLLMRRLDEGLSIPPMPGAWRWWWGTVKQQLLFAALPVVLILAWSEGVGFVRDGLWAEMVRLGGWPASPPWWAGSAPGWLLERGVIVYGSGVLQLAGVVGLLALMPVALRLLWDTVPLGAGSMRAALERMCVRYRVGVREILVWRTHGAMVNGAVVGFVPRLRYIVLTDTLLESLPWVQVEGVAAHEIAHAKYRHIPWLAGSMVATGVCVGSVVAAGGRVLEAAGLGGGVVGWAESWGPVGIALAGFGLGLSVFGWASRRFEWQADIFAARHLSRSRGDGGAGGAPGVVTVEGAGAMAEALRSVALINGFPADRFTFRHGSITGRCAHLMASVGEPLGGGGAADRAAGRVKLAVVAMGVCGVTLAVFEVWRASSGG